MMAQRTVSCKKQKLSPRVGVQSSQQHRSETDVPRVSSSSHPFLRYRRQTSEIMSQLVRNNDAFDSDHQPLLAESNDKHTYSSITVVSEKPEPWQLNISEFLEKKQGEDRIKKMRRKKVREFYRKQDSLIDDYEDTAKRVRDGADLDLDAEAAYDLQRALFYSKVTFFLNFLLMAAKVVAAVLSGSLSIISSLIDSCVDLLSGVIMWWAARAIRKKDRFKYPQGRTKLEPVSIIVLSVVMSLASVVFVQEAVTKIIDLTQDVSGLPTVEIPVVAIAGSTVVVKFLLWLWCRTEKSNMVQALALDHRNDVVSNAAALIFGYLGSVEFQDQTDLYGFIYVDPGGAIFISLYIIVNWALMGAEQVQYLTGKTADSAFQSKVLWVALNHDERIGEIETVRAFHFGHKMLVDVDVVLPPHMPVHEAHDIAEGLQRKLERLEDVERAYVHVDYETDHKVDHEHKIA